MDTFAVLNQLKLAVERDFAVLQNKQSEIANENSKLLESNRRLSHENDSLKQQQESSTKRLIELQNELSTKTEQLHSNTRKLEKLQKQDSWWQLYLRATEVRIGVLRKCGSFPDNAKEWLDKDVNEIIDLLKRNKPLPLEVGSKKPKKLSISKSHKRTRYSDMSPMYQNPAKIKDCLQQNVSVYCDINQEVDIINSSRGKENSKSQCNKFKNSNDVKTKGEKNNICEVLNENTSQHETIDKAFDELAGVDLVGETTVKYSIGLPSLTSTPILSTDKQRFFPSEMECDILSEVMHVSSGKPYSPTVKSDFKLANISTDLTADQNDDSMSIIPKETSNPHNASNNNKIMLNKEKNVLAELEQMNNASNTSKRHDLVLDSHTGMSAFKPNPSKLVNVCGNRQTLDNESGKVTTPAPSVATQRTELSPRTELTQNKRKRDCANDSDQELYPAKKVKEKVIIDITESPKQVTSLFKVPTLPSSPLVKSAAKSLSSPPSNHVTDDETTAEIETSDMDLFGDLGVGHADNPKINNEIENEKDLENCVDDDTKQKGAPQDDGKKHSETLNCTQPQVTNSKSTSAHDFDNDFNEEERYREYLRQRKEPEAPYKYQEVVRKKDQRAKLNGYSCRECDAYFSSFNLTEAEKKNRMKGCSRHRAKFSPPPNTPEGFWNLSFPETQEYMDKGYMRSEEVDPFPRKSNKARRARRKLAQE